MKSKTNLLHFVPMSNELINNLFEINNKNYVDYDVGIKTFANKANYQH